jgi:hypothetical protein
VQDISYLVCYRYYVTILESIFLTFFISSSPVGRSIRYRAFDPTAADAADRDDRGGADDVQHPALPQIA